VIEEILEALEIGQRLSWAAKGENAGANLICNFKRDMISYETSFQTGQGAVQDKFASIVSGCSCGGCGGCVALSKNWGALPPVHLFLRFRSKERRLLCKETYETDMMRYFQFVLFILGSLAVENLPPIHYTISRRSGSFPTPDIANNANLTFLLEQLQIVEQRFNTTTRDFTGNKVVRRPRRLHGTQASSIMLGDVGREGNWFASLHIGEPVQEVNMDLDMLTADWWIFSTSSGTGSFYLDFNSKTHGKLYRPAT
jgi:hypothetical protein